jgi:hypothetical protein
MKLSTLPIILLSLFFTANLATAQDAKMAVIPEISNGIELKLSEGIQLVKAYLFFDDGKKLSDSNFAELKQKVNLLVQVQPGSWTEKDGKVSIGASEKITTPSGGEVLNEADLFATITDINAVDAQYITLKAIITSMVRKFDYFLVNFTIWDKWGSGIISGSYKLRIKPNTLTVTSPLYNKLVAVKTLTPTLTIQLPEGDGSNSGAVVWNPIQKKYYTAMAGNASYTMGVYTATGKPVQESVEAAHDYRGIWYNPVSKKIEFNCYDTDGIGHLVLDAKGNINSKEIDLPGMNQPDAQCIGVYYPSGNYIIYFNQKDYSVVKYAAKTGVAAGVLTTLHVGCNTKKEVDAMEAATASSRWESRNTTCVQYTGLPKRELAVLNFEAAVVELYDQKTGLLTAIYNIPKNVSVEQSFNFSCSNGIFWFFNKKERKWVGCK